MANEPTLGEINSYRPDAQLAKGVPGVVYDLSDALRNVTDAARFHAQNIAQKYAWMQKDLADYAQNHQLDFTGVMREDIPSIEESANKYFTKIKNDPSLIHEQNDPDWIDLQAKIAKSKQDNGYLTLQESFRQSHPDLFNDANDKIQQNYRNTPLDQRSTFTWQLPSYLDAQTLAGKTLSNIGEKFDVSTDYRDENGKPVEGYFLETKGTKYDQDKFQTAWQSLFDSNQKVDDYGHTIKDSATEQYSQLPVNVQQQFDALGKQNGRSGLEEYWNQLGQAYYKTHDITDTQLTENKFKEHQDELAIAKQRLGLDWSKFNKDQQDDALGADAVINQAVSILNKGVPMQFSNFGGRGVTKDVLEISDPTLLNTFGKIDKDGSVTNVPDAVFFDKDKGQLQLSYYKKDPDQLDGIMKDSKGNKVLDHTQPLDERTWLNEITKRSFPNKDIGGVNSIIDQVLNKSGNSLYNVALSYKGEVPTSPKTTKTTVDLSKLTPVQKGGKTYYVDSVKRIVYDSNGNVIK